mmetsp:Transcript_26276/g.105160  ORF Transcript_26276/g.105160 Transcript_26276/m.105160 type:complete len:231 (-) Transcript_26276:436-1128(-)
MPVCGVRPTWCAYAVGAASGSPLPSKGAERNRPLRVAALRAALVESASRSTASPVSRLPATGAAASKRARSTKMWSILLPTFSWRLFLYWSQHVNRSFASACNTSKAATMSSSSRNRANARALGDDSVGAFAATSPRSRSLGIWTSASLSMSSPKSSTLTRSSASYESASKAPRSVAWYAPILTNLSSLELLRSSSLLETTMARGAAQRNLSNFSPVLVLVVVVGSTRRL